VIVLLNAPAPAKYVGLRFALRSSWMEGRYPLLDWMRWWTGQKPTLAKPQTEEVVLWVRKPLP
jgi:hypothetical protein